MLLIAIKKRYGIALITNKTCNTFNKVSKLVYNDFQ